MVVRLLFGKAAVHSNPVIKAHSGNEKKNEIKGQSLAVRLGVSLWPQPREESEEEEKLNKIQRNKTDC